MSCDNEYIVIQWPEISELMDFPDFDENCHLINDECGLSKFGSSSYFVKKSYYNQKIK